MKGAATGGPGSPSWLAAHGKMQKHAHHSIDWEMSRGLKLTHTQVRGAGLSDHNLVTFTVKRNG